MSSSYCKVYLDFFSLNKKTIINNKGYFRIVQTTTHPSKQHREQTNFNKKDKKDSLITVGCSNIMERFIQLSLVLDNDNQPVTQTKSSFVKSSLCLCCSFIYTKQSR